MNDINLLILNPVLYIALLITWFFIPRLWRPLYSIGAFILVLYLASYITFQIDPLVKDSRLLYSAFYISLPFYYCSSIYGFWVKDRRFKMIHIILSVLITIFIVFIIVANCKPGLWLP